MIAATVPSPLGPLTLKERGNALVSLRFWGGAPPPATDLLRRAADQLAAYFDGAQDPFDLPLAPQGTPFERAVFDVMTAIPFGHTLTYGAVAARIGGTARAVGQACGANPLPVVIPCHRILAADGLGGYSGAGGVDTKVALLRLEGAAGLLI